MKWIILLLPLYAHASLKDFKGCFVWKKIGEEKLQQNSKSCREAHTPYSTFKLPNTLIGLETGVVTPETVHKWDGLPQPIKDWEQDHKLASAIKVSSVPYYQALARQVGMQRMQEWLNRLGYGNRKIADQVDNFWLVGPLKITPIEQLTFMEQLYTNQLPVKRENAEILKSIIIHEDTPEWRLSGKTGSQMRDGKMFEGWFVGHLKTAKGEYVFTIYEAGDGVGGRVVMGKAREFLKELKL